MLGEERRTPIAGTVLRKRAFEKYALTLREDILQYLPLSYKRAAQWLCGQFPSPRLQKWLLPQPSRLGIFKFPVKLIESVQRLGRAVFGNKRRLDLGNGDILILPDAYWALPEIWKSVASVRQRGVYIVVVLHDIIPLTHPAFVPSSGPREFREYLSQVVSHADLIVTVSQTIRDQLRQELPSIFPDRTSFPPVEAFRNGAGFAPKGGAVRQDLVELFARGGRPTPYLTVSTFDPRKNHPFTLDAFETLWASGKSHQLLFVGSRGWMSDDIIARIESHPQRDKNLFLYHDLTDSELHYCYQHARGTITSSFVEGFGLPIVESLWHGRKTFASDTPIHREVGGEQVSYFDLTAPDSLAQAIETWERQVAQGEPVDRPTVAPMSWRESTELLLETCLTAYASRRNSAQRNNCRSDEEAFEERELSASAVH